VQNTETGQRASTTLNALFAAVAISALAACGGGGSSEPAAPSPPPPAPFVTWTPSATVLAAKVTNSTLRFSATGSALAAGQGCADTLTNTTVYEQANTVVFAAAGVTEQDQQEVADYAEAAAVEMRRTFGLTSSVGFGTANKKVYICAQTQRFQITGGVAAATPLTNAAEGIVIIQSPASFYAQSPRANFNLSGVTNQAFYSRILPHELTHLVEQFRRVMDLDQWMTEGVARYMEFGKPAISLQSVQGFFSAQNPISIAWPGTDARAKVMEYNAAGSVMAYLFSPTGANNNLSAFLSMINKMNTDSAAYVAGCRLINFTSAACTGTALEVQRSAYFVAAFEATFKERDGTPMKLRTGANNLQDTIVARLTAWW
jgi:hypothetical protein